MEPSSNSPGDTIFGIVFPFRRGANDIDAGRAESALRSDLVTLLTTPSGHLPWRTDFGCRLHAMKHMPMTAATADQVRHFVMDAVSRWLPSITVVGCEVRPVRTAGLLKIRITYRLRNTDVSGTLDLEV